MKEFILELAKLAVQFVIVMICFMSFWAVMSLIIKGADYLPQYIGGVGTFLLYVSFFMLMFAGIYEFNKRQK